MFGIFDTIADWLHNVAAFLLQALPDCPIKSFADGLQVAGWIHALNWVIPFGNFVAILTVWTGCIVIFYAYKMILRWAKVAGSS